LPATSPGLGTRVAASQAQPRRSLDLAAVASRSFVAGCGPLIAGSAAALSGPADLGIEVLAVPEGAQVDLDLRLEAVMEGVLVTGSATADLEGQCARCLEPITDQIEVTFQELFLYDDHGTPEEDDEVSTLEDDLLDLEPLLRDEVVLALPFQPLCKDDCPGLCTECGARLAEDPDHTHEAAIDPRWAGLTALTTEAPPED